MMALSYYCADDREMLTAPSKEMLADKMVEHMRMRHGQEISRDQAMQDVDAHAKESAA
jgi:hypothetical protein